jgi:hypothetical protein
MSRLNELKRDNPSLILNVIEIINSLFNKSKYTELSVNLIKNYRDNRINNYDRANNLKLELINEFKLDEDFINSKSNEEIINIHWCLVDYFGYYNFELIKKFEELNERNLIINNDLTKFKTFEELELEVSLAELKSVTKDLEKQTIKLYENDEWLVIKPMSFLASKKYGASTRWCTTMENNPDYYLKYSRNGILIYCLNKKTGDKVAAYKSLSTHENRETSFWDMSDARIDSIESGLPNEVMEVIKNEFINVKKTNWDLLSEDDANNQLLWIQRNSYDKPLRIGVQRNELTNDENIEDYIEEISEYVEEVDPTIVTPQRARIVPFIPRQTSNDDDLRIN